MPCGPPVPWRPTGVATARAGGLTLAPPGARCPRPGSFVYVAEVSADLFIDAASVSTYRFVS